MTEPRELSLDEANALVPTLHRLVGRQMLVQDAIEAKLRLMHAMEGSLPNEIVVRPDDPVALSALKEEIIALLKQFEEGWAEVAELGAVVKDPHSGLVDFYGRVDGVLVFLCWRYGEEAIGHYHSLTEGFAGRKPIGDARSRHRLLS